jgi:hypothetical protein
MHVAEWLGPVCGQVLDMAYDATGLLLATASVDRTVRVWNADKSFATHSLKGHSAMVSRVTWHPNPQRLTVLSCSDDGEIRVWDLRATPNGGAGAGASGGVASRLLTSHVGLATALAFVPGHDSLMVSAGRDRVLTAWNIDTGAVLLTTPTYESIEALTLMTVEQEPPRQPRPPAKGSNRLSGMPATTGVLLATGGERGHIRVWRMTGEPNADLAMTLIHTHALPQSQPFAGTAAAAAAAAAADLLPDAKAAESKARTESVALSRLLTVRRDSRGGPQLIAVTSDHNLCTHILLMCCCSASFARCLAMC